MMTLKTPFVRIQGTVPETNRPPEVRKLPDDTVIIFLSDTHIGGDNGSDIFESPDDLTMLFQDLSTHDEPVELVLAGDFFDFLRISKLPDDKNRASVTIERPEYCKLFDALREFNAIEKNRVVYLPGNHDVEMWWNADIRRTLREEGLVHDFALSYMAYFESRPDDIIYCEHGNQFDPTNAIRDYRDPLDTPLGSHVVTDVIQRITKLSRNFDLHDLNHVFPLVAIPDWISSRFFYDLLRRAILYLILPIIATYMIVESTSYMWGFMPDEVQQSEPIAPWMYELWIEVGYYLLPLIIFFFYAVQWMMQRVLSSLVEPHVVEHENNSGVENPQVKGIHQFLKSDHPPPMGSDITGKQISVFVSGHTHTPVLSQIQRSNGMSGVFVNSGCWLRQLQPVRAHLYGPPVFVPVYVQTHGRIYLDTTRILVELWEYPRITEDHNLLFTERLAILGRQPKRAVEHSEPQLRATAEL